MWGLVPNGGWIKYLIMSAVPSPQCLISVIRQQDRRVRGVRGDLSTSGPDEVWPWTSSLRDLSEATESPSVTIRGQERGGGRQTKIDTLDNDGSVMAIRHLLSDRPIIPHPAGRGVEAVTKSRPGLIITPDHHHLPDRDVCWSPGVGRVGDGGGWLWCPRRDWPTIPEDGRVGSVPL